MTKIDNILNRWSDAHVFYSSYLNPVEGESTPINTAEYKWRKKLVNNTPNGKLILHNSIFTALKSNKVYLMHVTTKLNELLKNRNLYPSGGCLIGGIYCSLLKKEDKVFRLHNLGEYILKQEAPRALNGIVNDIVPLIIELTLPEDARNQLIGVDYLRIGKIHLAIYKELEYLLSLRERNKLEEKLIRKIKKSIDFLNICNKIFVSQQAIKRNIFFEKFKQALDSLPILGYIYFEAVIEYLLLYQNDAISKKYSSLGELYNWHYKDLIFKLYPKLLSNFKLSLFKPGLDTLIACFKQNAIPNIDATHFSDHIVKRISFLISARLLNNGSEVLDIPSFEWRFHNITQTFGPLVGHLIHRELRTFGRYPDFYYYYDQIKALQIWNYWNHNHIFIPFNGLIPKGEVGINPAYANKGYKIYKGIEKISNGQIFIEPEKELSITIVPRLVELKYSFMRNKN